ncbi:hypothetical protein SAMN05444955_12315 [Lihuaxuella thermophila]|uniref:Uncharacterized protein n=1 Tax=Lihuaxuella thermophila TaxID=1173111 RepID=A0A1H8JAI5_9BACL|nr:hypothetical protein SAMN05444955_12315 [Lihuaxuella thermophila]
MLTVGSSMSEPQDRTPEGTVLKAEMSGKNLGQTGLFSTPGELLHRFFHLFKVFVAGIVNHFLPTGDQFTHKANRRIHMPFAHRVNPSQFRHREHLIFYQSEPPVT